MSTEIKGWPAFLIICFIGALAIFASLFFTFNMILAVQKSLIPSAIVVIGCLVFSGFIIYYTYKHYRRLFTGEQESPHKSRLKEAQRVYMKNFKAFKQGKISKEELKEALRPYKNELMELGYPVKIKEGEKKERTDS